MDDAKRLEVIDERYRKRREAGEDGWAADASYPRKAATFERLVAAYALPPGARVLELGCGAGNTALAMARRGYRAAGIDIAPEAIEWAKEKAEAEGLDAEFAVDSVAELSGFEADSLDLIFDGDCLWMVLGDDRARCFTSVYRCLAPGGVFFAEAHLINPEVTERHEIGPGAWYDPTTRISTGRGVPLYQYSTEASFRAEIEAAGLTVVALGTVEMEDTGNAESMPFVTGTIFIDARKEP